MKQASDVLAGRIAKSRTILPKNKTRLPAKPKTVQGFKQGVKYVPVGNRIK